MIPPATLARLREQLAQGRLTLIIGSELPRELTGLPSRGDLAQALAARQGLEPSRDLAAVAQRVVAGGSRFPVIDFLGRQLDPLGRPAGRLHRLAAGLPFAAFISLAYDGMLEQALGAAGVAVNRIVRAADTAFADPRRPDLIRLYGDLQQRDTLVLTQDDLYGLLRSEAKADLADAARAALRRTMALIVGCDLASPDFQLLWGEILERGGAFTLGAVAAVPGLPPGDGALWRARQIEALDVAPLDLLEALGASGPGRPADQPAEAVLPAPASAPQPRAAPALAPPAPSGGSSPTACTLTFRPAGAAAEIDWGAPVLGARRSAARLPYAGADLELVLRALDLAQSGAEVLRPAEQADLAALGLPAEPSAGLELARAVGRALYGALTADPAGARALATARDHAAALGAPLELHLHFPPDAMDWGALPWELLWDEGPAPLLLSRGQAATCARYLDLPVAAPPPPPRAGPLRILAVTPHAGNPDLGPEPLASLWRTLEESGLARVRTVSPATRRGLIDAVLAGPPDVVHFTGHGRYHEGQAYLILDAEDGGWDRAPMRALLPVFGGVRLALMLACQGAAVGEAGLLSGAAQMLCAEAVPMVVAMQRTVRVAAALRIAEVFYQALAAGASVPAALGWTRRALYTEEPDGVSWFVPVLYLRGAGPTTL